MKRQQEYDALKVLISEAEQLVTGLKNQQRLLARFQVGDKVKYREYTGVISSIDNMGYTIKYTLVRLDKYGKPSFSNILAWYVEEEELEISTISPSPHHLHSGKRT